MAVSLTTCPTCKKGNKEDARYCIHCGSILKVVYCSQCGTVNPDDLSQCLECGNPIPKLTDIRWGPIVNVLQPTSAMVGETPQGEHSEPEIQELDDQRERSLLSKIKGRFSRMGSRGD